MWLSAKKKVRTFKRPSVDDTNSNLVMTHLKEFHVSPSGHFTLLGQNLSKPFQLQGHCVYVTQQWMYMYHVYGIIRPLCSFLYAAYTCTCTFKEGWRNDLPYHMVFVFCRYVHILYMYVLDCVKEQYNTF